MPDSPEINRVAPVTGTLGVLREWWLLSNNTASSSREPRSGTMAATGSMAAKKSVRALEERFLFLSGSGKKRPSVCCPCSFLVTRQLFGPCVVGSQLRCTQFLLS